MARYDALSGRSYLAPGYGTLTHRVPNGSPYAGYVDVPTDPDKRQDDWKAFVGHDGYDRLLVVLGAGGGAGGLGLFDHGLFADGRRTVILVQAAIRVGADVDWTLAVTNGLGDGDPATTIDDPADDLVLLRGTGNQLVTELMVRLSPSQYIRFTSDAVTRSGVGMVTLSYVTAIEGATDVPVL